MLNHPFNDEGAKIRLLNDYQSYGSLIIGLDFDNTICDYNTKEVFTDIISLLKRCQNLNFSICLYTLELDTNNLIWKFNFLKNLGINIDYINESPILKGSSKPFFNILLDDHAGLESAYKTLLYVVEYAEQHPIEYKNFPIKIGKKDYWISRSVASSIKLLTTDKFGVDYVLAVKRGSAIDHPGEWCLPGGYLDYGETIEQCARRELNEETGLLFNFNDIPFSVLSDPKYSTKKQVVTCLYKIFKSDVFDLKTTTEFSEPNEIEEVKWIPYNTIENYKWMYNKELFDRIFYEEN